MLTYAVASSSHRYGGAGTIIHFDITRNSGTCDVHSIDFHLVNNNAKFVNEKSTSASMVFDKIRYTYDSNNGYIDIHVSASTQYSATINFKVSGTQSYQKLITSNSLEAVGDAPSNETILATHTFSANGFTPNLPILTSNGDLSKTGNLLSLDPGTVSVPNSTWTEMGSLTLTPGRWLITYLVYFGSTNAGAEGRRRIIVTNSSSGTTPISFYMADERPAIAGVYSYCNATFVYNITSQASKTVYFKAYQTSGVPINVNCQINAIQIS